MNHAPLALACSAAFGYTVFIVGIILSVVG
jgi:hypothetical protein